MGLNFHRERKAYLLTSLRHLVSSALFSAMCSSNGYLRSGKCAIGHSGTGKSSFVDHLVWEQALAPSRDK